jgi:hypothetical protein
MEDKLVWVSDLVLEDEGLKKAYLTDAFFNVTVNQTLACETDTEIVYFLLKALVSAGQVAEGFRQQVIQCKSLHPQPIVNSGPFSTILH